MSTLKTAERKRAANVLNLEQETIANEDYRRVIYTGRGLQLVLMTIAPGQRIGAETHREHDQFICVESGVGQVVLDGEEYMVSHGTAVLIPAGVEHDLVNVSRTQLLRLYTVYAPPEHPHNTVHRRKADEPLTH